MSLLLNHTYAHWHLQAAADLNEQELKWDDLTRLVEVQANTLRVPYGNNPDNPDSPVRDVDGTIR